MALLALIPLVFQCLGKGIFLRVLEATRTACLAMVDSSSI